MPRFVSKWERSQAKNVPEFLHPRAAVPRKTYVGANFCLNESRLRDIYEGLPAQSCIDVNAARVAVQQGADAVDQLADLNIGASKKAVVGQCLATIAAGQCLAYPKGQ